MSKQDVLCPMRTIMTWLFVINFALFTDCDKSQERCDDFIKRKSSYNYVVSEKFAFTIDIYYFKFVHS